MSTTLTPASDKSTYFDAPIAHFNMSTPAHDLDQPIARPNGSEPVAVLAREPTVVGTGVSPNASPKEAQAATRDTAADAQDADDAEKVHIHPNGSQGWLPAADDDGAASQSPRFGSLLRKNGSVHSRAATNGAAGSSSRAASLHRAGSIGGQSTGRRSIFTNSEGKAVAGSTFISGAGTTGPNASAEPDESLLNRSATANGTLTPKQRSKIAKSESMHIHLSVRVSLTVF